MKKDKGITLIALVITIIVLLILAGVALSALTGNDNIIQNAGTTVDNYNAQQETDEAVLNTIAGYLESHMPQGENGGADDEVVEPEVDKTPPTITAKEESVTITEGQKYLLSEYFTIEPDATTEGVKVTYTINGQEYADTENLTATGSPYTITCTASKNGGESNSATMTLVVQPSWKISVTAKQETLDTTIMETKTFDSLFTVATGDGGTTGLTKTYTLNGETTSYSNTNELPAGTYTLNCTATYGGETASASVTVTMAKNYWVNMKVWEEAPEPVTIPERC